jgi:hypothetical protein
MFGSITSIPVPGSGVLLILGGLGGRALSARAAAQVAEVLMGRLANANDATAVVNRSPLLN